MSENLTKLALDAADHNGTKALLAAVRITRWQRIMAGEIEPLDDEWLPETVVEALAARAQAAA